MRIWEHVQTPSRRRQPRLVRARLSLTVVGATLLGVAACNDSVTPPKRTPTASASPSAGTGVMLDAPHPAACASVKTTTPIQQVPVACAKVWAPYNVTMVPPPDVIANMHVPAPPKVLNRTGGKVNDAQAQRIAVANQYQTAWYVWATMYSQAAFLTKIEAPQDTDRGLADFLSTGGKLNHPECAVAPAKVGLFPLGSDGALYFTQLGTPVDAAEVIVTVQAFPCVVTAARPDGSRVTLPPISNVAQATVATPGRLLQDPVLGEIWYAEAAGLCSAPTVPPTAWCQVGT